MNQQAQTSQNPDTVTSLREIARCYASKTAFKKGSRSAYDLALKLKIMTDICSHMQGPIRPQNTAERTPAARPQGAAAAHVQQNQTPKVVAISANQRKPHPQKPNTAANLFVVGTHRPSKTNQKRGQGIMCRVSPRFRNQVLANHYPGVGGQKSRSDRESLLASSMYAIKKAATHIFNKCNASMVGLEIDDLVSIGVITALEQIDQYDSEKGSFLGFTLRRIQGSMVDYIRNLSPISRCQMEQLRAALDKDIDLSEASFEDIHIKPTSTGDKAESKAIFAIATSMGALVPLQLDEVVFQSDERRSIYGHDIVASEDTAIASSEEFMIASKVITDFLEDHVPEDYQLTPAEKSILVHKSKGLTHEEIAKTSDITASRVSQIEKGLLQKIRNYMSQDDELLLGFAG